MEKHCKEKKFNISNYFSSIDRESLSSRLYRFEFCLIFHRFHRFRLKSFLHRIKFFQAKQNDRRDLKKYYHRNILLLTMGQLWNYFESRQTTPNKASVTVLERGTFERGNRVINVSDHRDHLLTRCGGRSKTFSLSFPSIFPPCSSHRTEKGDPPGVHCWRVPVWRATTGTFPGPRLPTSLFHEPIFLQIYARSASKYPHGRS